MGKNKHESMEINSFKSTANLTSNPGFQSSLSVATTKSSDEKPYNPFEHRSLEHPNTTLGSILHLLKACLGTGLLAMPSAFKNSGLVAGAIGVILAGFICTHTVNILVKTAQDLCVDAKKPSMSFAETCGAAFTYGPKRLRSWGNFIQEFVDYSLIVTYFSVLCVYVVFMGSSVKEVADYYYPELNISIQMYCIVTLIPLILLCQIRQLKYLVPFSALANICIVVVLIITLYYIFYDIPPISERVMVADISTWPLFLSTVIFAMEGIGVVMPVENEMKHPQRFLGCPGVLNVSMIVVITMYGIMGFFGYVQFGDTVKGSVTLNLPEDHVIAQSTKLLMAFVIFLSYALQFYVPMEILTRKLSKRETKYMNLIQISIRTVIVAVSVGIAAAFPNLELVIGFVGAIFFSTLGLLFPAIVELVYRWDRDLGPLNYVLWKNILIAIISVIALVSGSYVSAVGMIDFYAPKGEESLGNHTLT